jgi:hypothetical protein
MASFFHANVEDISTRAMKLRRIPVDAENLRLQRRRLSRSNNNTHPEGAQPVGNAHQGYNPVAQGFAPSAPMFWFKAVNSNFHGHLSFARPKAQIWLCRSAHPRLFRRLKVPVRGLLPSSNASLDSVELQSELRTEYGIGSIC